MNRKYREFMQRQNHLSHSQDDLENGESMRQLFGNSPDNPTYQEEKPKRVEIDVENIPIPTNQGLIKKGFIGLGVIFIIQAVFLLGYMKIFDFLGATIMAIFSFLFAWKVRYRYTDESNYFFYNFTVTLKGVLNHYKKTAILLEASEKIFIYSIVLMAIQHFLLSWFSLTSILYSIGYYGMFLGIIFNLAKRKTELLYKGMFLYSIMLILMIFQNVFGALHYINYHTSITLLAFWYLGGFFQSLKIAKVHINERNEESEMNFPSEDNDELI